MSSDRVAALAKEDVLRAAGSFRPARKLQKWIVIIDGKEFPARPLLLHAAGVAPNDSTNSHQAIAKLRELGFETRYAADAGQPGIAQGLKATAGDQFSRELDWLEANREAYAGQWVAVQGNRLLAAGPEAREVFARVRDVFPSPLVVRVEGASLPFAGW